MDLTPNDIRNFEFPTQLRGYDKDTVEKFAEQVAEALEALKQENVKLSMQLESTKGELDGLKEFEDAIKSAAIDARRNADMTVATAQKDAEKILTDAREEAENIIQSNQHKLESVQAQLKKIGATRASYIEQLQDMMRTHLSMIDAIERDDALAISPDEQIHVTDSAEVDESQKEALARAEAVSETVEEASEKNEMPDLSEGPAPAALEPAQEKSETDKLKEVLAEPVAVPSEEIDPELAQALQSYKKNVTQEQTETAKPSTPAQPPVPRQGEMVETTARAEDIPDGFVSNSNKPAIEENSVNLDPSKPKDGEIDLASELDDVVAKFEEEMDKAAKS